MSGGLDSSVAALMLHEQGYEVIGITMKTWDFDSAYAPLSEKNCCNQDSINDARTFAVKYDFPHYVIDISDEFENLIINNFVDEYLAGRTPNPCVLCNVHIKWDALLKHADNLNCEFIATGHYARIRKENNRYVISKGIDKLKDQSYVLWGISQENLRRTILPLGNFQKKEIREVAKKNDFGNLARKKESFEICFIPDNDYRGFLNKKVKDLEDKYKDGNVVSTDGKILGKHKGYPFYTIGQRKGLNLAFKEPMYVNKIDAKTNTVVLGTKSELLSNNMLVKGVNLVKYPAIPDNMKVNTKIRYHDEGTLSNIIHEGNSIKVKFQKDVSAITPGQSAVFYEGDDVIAGGFIN